MLRRIRRIKMKTCKELLDGWPIGVAVIRYEENGEIKHRYKMNCTYYPEAAEANLREHLIRVCRGATFLEYAVQEPQK